MDLKPYVGSLAHELLAALVTGEDDAAALIERMTVGMESAIRLVLLEALSDAADEITRDLAPGWVQVRLRGRDPQFVVSAPPIEQPAAPPPDPTAEPVTDAGYEDGPTARINVRLPEKLKSAVEEAAGEEGRSVNAWLVRAAAAALRAAERDRDPGHRSAPGAQRLTGWVS